MRNVTKVSDIKYTEAEDKEIHSQYFTLSIIELKVVKIKCLDLKYTTDEELSPKRS